MCVRKKKQTQINDKNEKKTIHASNERAQHLGNDDDVDDDDGDEDDEKSSTTISR